MAHLAGTEERWKDLNHLLISSQKKQTNLSAPGTVPFTGFLRKLGITEADLAIET
jgi:hypothetical protein